MSRLAAIPGWPYSATGVLVAAAVAEVLFRPDSSGLGFAVTLVLAIASTAPVASLLTHWIAPATLTLAATMAVLSDGRLTIAGMVGVVITFYVVSRTYPAWQAAALAIPLLLLAAGSLAVSGEAASDESVNEGADPGDGSPRGPVGPVDPVELPPPEPREPLRLPSDGANTYPLLVAGLALAGAGAGLMQRTQTTEERLVASEASVADVSLAHSAQGERVRIARELHDVVAHRITSIAVQAESARLTTPGLTEEGQQRLSEIGDSARDALSEMRQLLGVLRSDTRAAADRAPQPGITELNDLIAQARTLSDASVRLSFHGPVVPLDPAIELTAFRIVQEALTNVRRHAAGAAVDVELTYGEDDLRVEVRDTGGSATADTSKPGHGLLGMRERVAMAGGEMSVGLAPAGGFVITATLPVTSGSGTAP